MSNENDKAIHRLIQRHHVLKSSHYCEGCMFCPFLTPSDIVPSHCYRYLSPSGIVQNWMWLFFSRRISFRELGNTEKRIVNFLFKEGFLVLDRESNDFSIQMTDKKQFVTDIGLIYQKAYMNRQLYPDRFHTPHVDKVVLDRTFEKYHCEDRVIARCWEARKVMFLIRHRAEPRCLWSIFLTEDTFRQITCFL